MLLHELDSDERKMIYELTDGVRTQKEISSIVNVSRSSIAYYWQKWQGLGILIPSSKFKVRMKKVIPLSQVGIQLPRKFTTRDKTEVSFQVSDLRKVLNDRMIFQSFMELRDFSLDFLPNIGLMTQMEREELLSVNSREQLVETIYSYFKNSSKMNQRLFLQALERRVIDKRGTHFRKYFEAWEKQIGR